MEHSVILFAKMAALVRRRKFGKETFVSLAVLQRQLLLVERPFKRPAMASQNTAARICFSLRAFVFEIPKFARNTCPRPALTFYPANRTALRASGVNKRAKRAMHAQFGGSTDRYKKRSVGVSTDLGFNIRFTG